MNYQDAPVISPEQLKMRLSAMNYKLNLHYPDINMKDQMNGMAIITLFENYTLMPMPKIEAIGMFNRLSTKLKVR